MIPMKRPLAAVAALLLTCGIAAQAAQPTSPPDAPPAAADARLRAAQERLEAAAREVAELSAQSGRPAPRIEMRIQRGEGPGPMQGPGGGMGPMGGRGMMGMPEGHPQVGGGLRRMEALRASGLHLAPMSPRLAGYFGAKAGVLVVRAANPAIKLEDGDVITAIGGRTPTSPLHALRIFRSYEPGEKVALQVLRDRKAITVEVTVPLARQEVRRIELRRMGPDAPPAPGTPGAPGTPPPAPPHQH